MPKATAKPRSKAAADKSVNLAALSREHGVSRETLRAWKMQGVNMANPSEITARKEAMRDKPSSELAAARLAKIKAETERIAFAHEVEKGRFVDAVAVYQDGVRAGALVRESFERLENELPPQLAGRTAGEISAILKRTFRQTLTNLSKYQSHVSINAQSAD